MRLKDRPTAVVQKGDGCFGSLVSTGSPCNACSGLNWNRSQLELVSTGIGLHSHHIHVFVNMSFISRIHSVSTGSYCLHSVSTGLLRILQVSGCLHWPNSIVWFGFASGHFHLGKHSMLVAALQPLAFGGQARRLHLVSNLSLLVSNGMALVYHIRSHRNHALALSSFLRFQMQLLAISGKLMAHRVWPFHCSSKFCSCKFMIQGIVVAS